MRILAALDGSDASGRALEFAAKLAKDLRGQLRVINVVSLRDIPLEQLDGYTGSASVTRPDAMTAESRDMLESARRRVEALGVAVALSESAMELREGETAETIIEAARRGKADLVVLGKRGLGRLAGLMLGSVSQKIVESAPCAVMVVA